MPRVAVRAASSTSLRDRRASTIQPHGWEVAMSNRWVHLLAACVAFALAAPAAAQEMTMGNVNPPRQGTSLAAQQFIDKVAELSGGKIKIAHHHSGALGGEREVAQQIQLGAVDFGPITTAPLSTL